MRAAGLLLAIGSAAALGVLVSAAPPTPALQAVVGTAAVPVDPPADPFPLRRQFLPDDQLDRLTADPRGPFRKLTKAEFETKVRAAADAVQLARTPPQVVTAAYRGRYDPGRLTGTADWTVANPSGRPALLPLDALRLAVTDISPALLFRGKPGGKELPASFLWVGADRETPVALDWSARGVEETDEERFDLGVPPAAIGTLELSFPADRIPTLAAGPRKVEATGPFVGRVDGERVWKWAVGGQSNFLLTVRPTNTPGAEVSAARAAVFDLAPGEARAAFDFTLDSPRGLFREHTFTTDAGVNVAAVSGDGIDRWQQDPPDGKTAGTLRVTWREPTTTAKVKVTAAFPLPGGAVAWACPGVRATALPGADTIEVNVSPDLKLDGWAGNDYRPGVNTLSKSLKVQFVGGFASQDGSRRPPTVRVRSAEPELATEEAITWRVEAGRTRLSALVKARVVRGPLPQLLVRTAPGYVLESAAVVPEDAAVSFGPLPGTPNTWAVEPSRAIPTGRTVEVQLEFRGPPGPAAPDPADPAPAAVPLPFPVFTPLFAADRQGTLTAVGDRLTPTARTALPVSTDAGGWVVKYRGREPGGVGLFAPEPTGVTADAVRLSVRNKLCEATVLARADDGPVGSLTLYVPHPEGRVKPADGSTAVPLPVASWLPLLTAADGWAALTAAGSRPPGVYWRVTFAQPKTGPFEVTTTYPVAAVDPAAALTLPLPHVGGSVGDTAVELAPELAAVYRTADARTADFPHTVSLEPLTAKPAAVPTFGAWRLADVRQENQIDGDGGLVVVVSGRVVAAAGRSLPLTLPAAAVVESAQVSGKWVAVKSRDAVSLPLPELPPDGVTFEVRYRLPTPPLGPLPKYVSPAPAWPTDEPPAVRWRFARGWLPWPSLADADECAGKVEVRAARSPVLGGVGFALGGLVLAVGVRVLLTGSRVRAAVVAAAVGGCGLAAWVAPLGWQKVVHPPLFCGLLVLAAAAFRKPPAAGSARRPSTVVRTAAVLAAVGVGVNAQPAGEPAVVYVVGTDAQAVYAPAAVLEKLDALAAPPLPDVIVSKAEYAATADDAVVSVAATFTLHCPRDGTHPFTLPLAGVRLEAMQLDGQDAFPDASKPDRYTLSVKGSGRHTLTARFAVVPTTTGGDREARFGGPEVHVCKVTFDAGAKGKQPDVPTRRGGQTASGPTATADHGAGRTLAVRWREATADGTKTTVSVKEAGVWDATESPDAGVWAAFAYRIEGGGLDRFEIDIPAGLVPTKVVVRPTDPRASPVGVRGWRIAPGGEGTRVVARLQQPADGRVLVLVRAVPARPLSANPVLRFPRAAGVADTDRDSIYAVRFPGGGSGNVTGAIDFPADAIVKDFPAVPEFAFDKQPPARVVKRNPSATAEVRATLPPVPPFAALGAEVLYTCGAWVEVDGAARVVAKDAGVVEFTVPDAIEVRDVRAVGLAGWGRTANKVQVWLKTPAAGEVLVRWAGSLPATGDVPLPRWGSAVVPAEPTVVRVRAADGYAVKPTQTTGLKAKPAADGEVAFTFEGSPPPMKLDVTPLPPAVPPRADPPGVRTPPPPVPARPSGSADSPLSVTAAPLDPWPALLAVAWAGGLLAAVVVLRGWRWRPERVAAVGALGWLAAGVGTPLGWAFAAVAAVGLMWRLARVVRRLM